MTVYAVVYFAWVTLLAYCVWARALPVVAPDCRHLRTWHPCGECHLHPDTAAAWRVRHRWLAATTLVCGYEAGAFLFGVL